MTNSFSCAQRWTTWLEVSTARFSKMCESYHRKKSMITKQDAKTDLQENSRRSGSAVLIQGDSNDNNKQLYHKQPTAGPGTFRTCILRRVPVRMPSGIDRSESLAVRIQGSATVLGVLYVRIRRRNNRITACCNRPPFIGTQKHSIHCHYDRKAKPCQFQY